MNISKVIVARLRNSRNWAVIPTRNIHKTSRLRSADHDPTHQPYSDTDYNIPFSTKNPYTLLLKFCLYFGSGFWLPFASYHYKRTRSLA